MAAYKYKTMDYGYLRIFVWTGVCILGIAIGGIFSYLFIFMLLLFAMLDHVVGRDTRNYPPQLDKQMSGIKFYRYITYAQLPVQICCLFYVGWRATQPEVQLWEQIGMVLCSGIIYGNIGINVAHELVHKETRLERTLGGILLSMVCYGTFKVEHIRGHHVNVATPLDASTPRFNQSLYSFLPQAYVRNAYNGFRLEAERLREEGRRAWGWRNELLGWSMLSLCWMLLMFTLFGQHGLVIFLAQSFIAITVLETINYIDHYGMERTKLANGQYSPVTHHHSWNASDILSNYGLLNLQRHSDHHAFPRRRYQILRHFDDSPQLPSGYAVMILLAFFPPLWRKVMNPLTLRYRKDVLGLGV